MGAAVRGVSTFEQGFNTYFANPVINGQKSLDFMDKTAKLGSAVINTIQQFGGNTQELAPLGSALKIIPSVNDLVALPATVFTIIKQRSAPMVLINLLAINILSFIKALKTFGANLYPLFNRIALAVPYIGKYIAELTFNLFMQPLVIGISSQGAKKAHSDLAKTKSEIANVDEKIRNWTQINTFAALDLKIRAGRKYNGQSSRRLNAAGQPLLPPKTGSQLAAVNARLGSITPVEVANFVQAKLNYLNTKKSNLELKKHEFSATLAADSTKIVSASATLAVEVATLAGAVFAGPAVAGALVVLGLISASAGFVKPLAKLNVAAETKPTPVVVL